MALSDRLARFNRRVPNRIVRSFAGRRVELTDPRVLTGSEGMAMLPAPVRAALRPLRVSRVLRLSAS